jgi:dihydroorotate dehydrogenase
MLYEILKLYLFQLEPEKAHQKIYNILEKLSENHIFSSLMKWLYNFQNPNLEKNIWGLTFKNPIGIAAGFDKNAEWINILPLLGFGFMEVGSVTPLPQEGNPKPRLFRLTKDLALLNRMGFNNQGMICIKKNLQKRKFHDIVIGINIGKNKNTPNELAYQDYCKCLEYLYEDGDYFVINISSPNTPHLRDLQKKDALKSLVEPVQNLNKKLGNKPLLIKIAPDITDENLMHILEMIKLYEIQGIVATNTTVHKENLLSYQSEMGDGGISGKPLQNLANQWIQKIRSCSDIPIIGVGGIMTPEDALAKIHLGADLLQIYTGFIYYGPYLPRDICQKILKNKFGSFKISL